MTDYARWWQWLTSRVAVEIVRLRTRRRGRHSAETRADTRRLDDQYADQLHAIAAELEPLPLYDESVAIRERYRREAWAATGTTEREFWAGRDRVDDLVAEFEATGTLPVPDIAAAERRAIAAQQAPAWVAEVRDTPNQRAGYWEARATGVLPERVIRVLTRAGADDTAIEADHATLEPYIVGLAGGDPYDGLGQDAWLDRLFAPVRVA